jgi:uncharacterized protein (TIGR03067 family)
MKPIWLVAFLAAPLLLLADERKPDTSKLVGTYTITSGERDGKAIPAAELAGSVITITREKIVGTDKDKKEFHAATYTIDTATKPWTIRMVNVSPKNEKSAGVIAVDGDTVKICYALPGGKAPTSFKAGEKQHCFILKRASP